jgi:Predicted hydrolases or acyltransferases (alpha/beta hydrolase superfamily)
MAEFRFEGKSVYYETYGMGKPILMLNGIMMSCASWKEFIEPLSAANRLILVDLLDQGKTSKMVSGYTHSEQIRLILSLMDHLGIDRLTVAGISYGSEIGLEMAAEYPERVEKLILFNATAATGHWLGDIGKAWNLASNDWESYYYTTIPVIYSPGFYEKHNDWMEKRKEILKPVFGDSEFIGAMRRLTDSSENYDVKDKLGNVKCPSLIVACDHDYLTPIDEQRYLADHICGSSFVVIQNSGHASMYEQPLLFAALILGFTNSVKMKYCI